MDNARDPFLRGLQSITLVLPKISDNLGCEGPLPRTRSSLPGARRGTKGLVCKESAPPFPQIQPTWVRQWRGQFEQTLSSSHVKVGVKGWGFSLRCIEGSNPASHAYQPFGHLPVIQCSFHFKDWHHAGNSVTLPISHQSHSFPQKTPTRTSDCHPDAPTPGWLSLAGYARVPPAFATHSPPPCPRHMCMPLASSCMCHSASHWHLRVLDKTGGQEHLGSSPPFSTGETERKVAQRSRLLLGGLAWGCSPLPREFRQSRRAVRSCHTLCHPLCQELPWLLRCTPGHGSEDTEGSVPSAATCLTLHTSVWERKSSSTSIILSLFMSCHIQNYQVSCTHYPIGIIRQ